MKYIPTRMGSEMPRWSAGALVLGLMLSTAKGLKILGMFGPGEALLLIFAVTVFVKQPTEFDRGVWRITFAAWYLLFVSLIAGFLIRSGMAEYQIFPRSLFAYVLCAIVGMAALRAAGSPAFLGRFVKAMAAVGVLLAGIVSLLDLSGVRALGGVELYWQGTTRFQGWSTDPNQFALIFMATPFLILLSMRLENVRLWSLGSFGVTLVAASALIGVQGATESDSLLIGWLCGFGYLAVVRFKRGGVGVRLFSALIGAFLLVLGASAGWLDAAVAGIEEFLGKDSQGETRLAIWRDSLEIILESPIVGLGPEVGPISVSGGVLEAHNNLLHLGMSAGILGILAYLAIVLTGARRAAIAGASEGVAAVGALFAFGFLHTTVRHPIFWTLIAVCACLTSQRKHVVGGIGSGTIRVAPAHSDESSQSKELVA